MNDIVETLRKQENIVFLPALHASEILKAEEELGLQFNDEYLLYASSFGAVSFRSHEWFGVCDAPRLSVVEVTKREKERNTIVPHNWYVIEKLGVDGVVIWQAPTGEIYQTKLSSPSKMICGSLYVYINKYCS